MNYVTNISNFIVYCITKIFLSRPSAIRELTTNQHQRKYNLTIMWVQFLSAIHLRFFLTFQDQRSGFISCIMVDCGLSDTNRHQIALCSNSNNHLYFLLQTLSILYLHQNQIGDTGAQHLGDALKTNQVSYFLSLSRQ